jgi:hypothetical protein
VASCPKVVRGDLRTWELVWRSFRAGCGGDDGSPGEYSGGQETWRNGQTIRDKRVRAGKGQFTMGATG